MIKQGEKIEIRGTFQEKVDNDWVEISDITPYTIKLRLTNVVTNTIYNLSTTDNTIQISADKKSYYFEITALQTSTLSGECTCEIALIDTDNNLILSDSKAIFTVNPSAFGRDLANS